MAELVPVVGNWYQHETGELFEVVAIDAIDATIEIQYYDGTIEEIDADSWEQMEIEEAQPPDDWTAAVDIDDEDFSDRHDQPGEGFDDPLDYLDRQD
ncbi:MAG: hypothetical protein H3C57_01160 [Gammaproteobacteria bacterium]|nr:hypothetical protein [Gammaproteobacteria bacterium]